MNDDQRHIVLIVDDTPENLRVLGGMLDQQGYEVRIATSGAQALEYAAYSPPDLILLDIMMPEMNGYEVCRRLKADSTLKGIPVIFISALGLADQKMLAFREGAVDYITKPFQVEEVTARVHTHIELKLHRDHLDSLVERQTRALVQQTNELIRAKEATIASMANLAECRDDNTGGHIQRTKHYVRVLAQQLRRHFPEKLSEDDLDLLILSVPLHDIGKVGIPDSILLKPSRLTEEEFEIMKRHTIYGSDAIRRTERVLGASSFLKFARELSEYHHEKWDGSGYPHGLRGTDIPLCARLMAVADVYDALICRRPYKQPLSHEETVRIITQGDDRTRAEQFDPDVLQAFSEIHREFDHIAMSLLE